MIRAVSTLPRGQPLFTTYKVISQRPHRTFTTRVWAYDHLFSHALAFFFFSISYFNKLSRPVRTSQNAEGEVPHFEIGFERNLVLVRTGTSRSRWFSGPIELKRVKLVTVDDEVVCVCVFLCLYSAYIQKAQIHGGLRVNSRDEAVGQDYLELG